MAGPFWSFQLPQCFQQILDFLAFFPKIWQHTHQLVVVAERDAQHAEEVPAELGGDLLLQSESTRVSFCWDGQG